MRGAPLDGDGQETTMTTQDQDYYYQRAEAELAMAEKSTTPEAVKVHYELAHHYLDRLNTPDQPSALFQR